MRRHSTDDTPYSQGMDRILKRDFRSSWTSTRGLLRPALAPAGLPEPPSVTGWRMMVVRHARKAEQRGLRPASSISPRTRPSSRPGPGLPASISPRTPRSIMAASTFRQRREPPALNSQPYCRPPRTRAWCDSRSTSVAAVRPLWRATRRKAVSGMVACVAVRCPHTAAGQGGACQAWTCAGSTGCVRGLGVQWQELTVCVYVRVCVCRRL